jgi:hypothetical protein
MLEAPFDPSESDRVRLRVAVAEIERQLACLAQLAPAADHRQALAGLSLSWATMVALMSPGTTPHLPAGGDRLQ